jgi:uroporphyrinogen decarboxylase
MQGRERVLKAIRRQPTDVTPWVPFVGVHGAALLGMGAHQYLRDAAHLVAGAEKARALYRPDALPVAFDLQLEAEVLGCRLAWAAEVPPSVASHPLEHGEPFDSLPKFDLSAGRFPLVFDAARRMRASFGDELALYGLITGPFTLASHLRGNDLFLDLYDDPEAVAALVMECAKIGAQVAREYIRCGVDVVAVVDPMVSQVSPDHYREVIATPINAVFDAIHEAGALGSMFVCGDASRVLDQLFASHADNVSVDENIPLGRARMLAEQFGKSFGGNMRLTAVLLFGSVEDARRHAAECLEIGGDTGYLLAPGCDLPYAVPPANLQAVGEVVHDPYQRQVAAALLAAARAAGPAAAAIDEPLPLEDHIVMDVVTLDSAACAPCQYMMAAATRAAAAVPGVEVREHKINTPAGMVMMRRLGVQNLPAIYIDRELAYSSIIPAPRDLVARLEQQAARRAARV